MDDREWALAWAQFHSLVANPPSQWDENEVGKYHEILADLEKVSGEDLSAFRVPEDELKQKVTSVTRGNFRRPATVTMSTRRYCSDRYMRQQMDGVSMYFDNIQAPAKPKRYGL